MSAELILSLVLTGLTVIFGAFQLETRRTATSARQAANESRQKVTEEISAMKQEWTSGLSNCQQKHADFKVKVTEDISELKHLDRRLDKLETSMEHKFDIVFKKLDKLAEKQ